MREEKRTKTAREEKRRGAYQRKEQDI